MKKIISFMLVFAMLFTAIPVAFAADIEYTVQTGDSSYAVQKGESIDVPVYITAAAGDGTMIGMAMLEIATPTGFTAAIKGGTGKTGANVTATNKVKVAVNQAFAASSTDPFIVVTYTATDSAENAELKIAGVKLSDADLGKIDSSKVEVKGATITVTGGSTPVVLDSISVNPTALTVPYANQSDIAGYVKNNVVVTANYSDASTKTVTDYTVDVAGTTATIAYEGKKATVTLTLEPAPTTTDYTVKTGDETYTVEKGKSVDVSVYITAAAGDGTMIGMAMLEIATPTGFTAAIKGGTGKTGANVTATNKVKVAVNQAFAASSTDPFIVVTYTATDSAENAELKIAGVKLSDADLGKIDSSKVEVKGATITVTGGSTPVVLDSISVNPTALTVPYANQSDIAGYVKNNVVVTANYSDASTKTVTDYTVDVAGTTATIAYEGKKATVTFTLEPAPTTTDYTVKTGDETYTVEKGKSVDVSVYITAAAGDGTMIGMAMLEIATPTGFTAAIKGGTGKTGANVTATNKVKVAVNQAFAASSTDPFIVVTYTATDSAENAELKIAGVKLSDADLGKIDSSKVEVKGATITVTGGSTPSEPTLTGISVNPDEVMVPYNQDVTQVIGTTNFSVTAFYDDETSKVLDRLEYDIKISDDGNTATVSYKGKTAAINIKYQPTPVLTVEKSEITVPYGTEDVEAYVKAEIKSGTVKLDETDLTFDDYVIEFTNGADTATVKYADDATITATVNVTYVTLTGVVAELNEGITEIVLPWSIPDGAEAEAIKSYIVVKGQLSDNTTVAIDKADYDVVYDAEKGEFYVTYGSLQSNVLKATKGTEPPAEVTGITISKDTVNVPYGSKTDEQIIAVVKGEIVVTATYDKGKPSDIAADAYEVTIADDKATITYEGFTADVTLVKETRKLELSNTEITVDEGTDKDGIIAYVKANVTAKYVYSQTTAEQTIPVDELAITVNDELTEVTVEVGGESAKIAVNIKVVPDFIETVKADTNAYGIATAKLVIFTDVKDGKVVKVTDEKGTYDAIYMGNGKWAAVVTGSYTAVAGNGSLPEAAKFGRLHDASMITAYDALLTLLKANNGAVNVFDNDYQKYLLADVDGNGTLTADEALYINRISLGNADESTLWFNK